MSKPYVYEAPGWMPDWVMKSLNFFARAYWGIFPAKRPYGLVEKFNG